MVKGKAISMTVRSGAADSMTEKENELAWCLTHSGKGQDHFREIKVWSGRFKDVKTKFMFNKHNYLVTITSVMIITGRLCHIMWSRKMT